MDTKPTVFIGSSTEGKQVANALKDAFGDRADVEVWNSGEVFSKNQSFLRSLLDASSLYEFAVLVFSSDDITVMRAKSFHAARDNVLFEFGLFLGRVGPRRAYALVERDLRVPSDLSGISLDHFRRQEDGMPTPDFRATAEKIVSSIVAYHQSTSEFSHLPSTALAIGYFHNFLSRVCDSLDDFEPVIIEERKIRYKSFTLHIIIPDDLKLLEDKNLKNILKGLEPVKINSSQFREFPFYMQGIPAEDATHLDLYDIPTTMRSSRETILKIYKEEYVGVSKLQARAEKREVTNFERTLRLLLAERPFWQKYIEYEYLSQYVRK